MTVPRRLGSAQSATHALILDATRDIMVAEGYAAVSARRVAAKAGIKPALVQYYFPTMDGLLLALYRHAADGIIERQAEALASPQPLRALWALSTDPARAALGVEFMALANHRKVISAEIAIFATRTRVLQAQTLEHLLSRAGLDTEAYPPEGVAVLLAGIARTLVTEHGVGLDCGHAAARQIIERWLQRLEPSEA
jgi:AcrR family transcriptional regulator